MKKILSVLLCLMLVFSLAACGEKAPEAETTAALVSGQTYGTGEKVFPLTVVDTEGAETTVTIQTGKETVGDALVELGIIAGDESEYGLYVKTVNGITLDYDKDGKYWAFYINGEYAMTGVDQTPIEDGASYTLAAE